MEDQSSTLESKSSSTSTPSRKRNAFSELMAARPKQMKVEPRTAQSRNHDIPARKPARDSFRTGLLPYVLDPDSCPQGTIVRKTEHTILIRDLYPKALVHLLLLPRDPALYNLTPFEAFNPDSASNAAFLELMRSEAVSAALLAASELSRLVSPYSTSCKARLDALESDDPPEDLPSARDFLQDIKIGVHAQPSMNTLHIHIISADSYSPSMKNKKHYNSFNSHFFIPLEDFPLMEQDNLMDVGEQEELIRGAMKCWRCGKNYGNRFKQLKEHLVEEYQEWRQV